MLLHRVAVEDPLTEVSEAVAGDCRTKYCTFMLNFECIDCVSGLSSFLVFLLIYLFLFHDFISFDFTNFIRIYVLLFHFYIQILLFKLFLYFTQIN